MSCRGVVIGCRAFLRCPGACGAGASRGVFGLPVCPATELSGGPERPQEQTCSECTGGMSWGVRHCGYRPRAVLSRASVSVSATVRSTCCRFASASSSQKRRPSTAAACGSGGAIRAGAAAVTGSGACVAAGDVPGLAGVAAVARTGEPSPSLPQVQRSTGCFAFHTSTSCCASSIVIAVRLSQFCARRLRRAVFVRVPSVGLRCGWAGRGPVAGYSRFCESIQIVTGPSLTSATCMSAPKTPVSTRPVAPWRTAATNDS